MWFLYYFLIHILVYSLLRLQFLVWNWPALKILSSTEILKAFIYGLRFDLSVIALTLGLAYLGLIWLIRHTKTARIWLYTYIGINVVLLVINFTDDELFNFTAKRFSQSSLYLVGEGGVSNLLLPYLPLVFASLCILALYVGGTLYLIRRHWPEKYAQRWRWPQKSLLTLALMVVAVMMSRGGLQLKPLTYVDAKIFSSSYANNLVLNSSFTFIKSLGKIPLKREHYFSQSEMLQNLNDQNLPRVEVVPHKPLNIMVILLESFSEEYMELRNPEVTPYLNSLRKKSVDFDRAYANGRRSIEGVAAVLSGIPALMEEPFISSEFSANQIIGLGTLLSSHGYSTAFFHAAKTGSMHFDSFSKSVGIENFHGLEEYPNQQDYDGTWGIYDEPYFLWTCQKLNDMKEPFFASFFSMTSHQPYALPEKYRSRFQDSRHEILKTVMYSDFALQEFMDCAQKQSWFKNTLFVITADHTGPALNETKPLRDFYKIPLLFYFPDQSWLKNVDSHQYAQQIDVLPTILDLVGIEQKNKNYLARSLLRSGPKLIALYSDHQYDLVGDVKNYDEQLKAVRQYFSEGLYDNSLYYPIK